MNYKMLPEGYELLRSIDLQKDRRLALLVNGLSLGIAIVMVICALPFVPFSTFISIWSPSLLDVLRPLLLLPALLVYVVTHELIHGFYMKRYSGVKPKYGFSGLYAYAGSEAFFDRRSYLIISLAPVILWGVLLMILNFALPVSCFWFIYIIQIMNISGAAGDFYVSLYMSRLPHTILIQDSGVKMDVYILVEKTKA